MKTPHNYKKVTMKLDRIDLCNLILATTSLKNSTRAEKWGVLHDKLNAILNEFDEKNPIDE